MKTYPVRVLGQDNTALESRAGVVRIGVRRDVVVQVIDEQDGVCGLDLEVSSISSRGFQLPCAARKRLLGHTQGEPPAHVELLGNQVFQFVHLFNAKLRVTALDPKNGCDAFVVCIVIFGDCRVVKSLVAPIVEAVQGVGQVRPPCFAVCPRKDIVPHRG